MDPVNIAVICAVVFGAVTALSVFVRQLLLSRDKNLNDRAQHRALLQESGELEKLRIQMENNKRFDSHYKVLGANKEEIEYIDQEIQSRIDKKKELIHRYAQTTLKESSAIIDGGQSAERKAMCDLLKSEIDHELQFYDVELQHLQTRRAAIWDARHDLQACLVAHEQSRNESLDKIYQRHTGLLEKIYCRHEKNTQRFAEKTLDAGTSSFKESVNAPVKLLKSCFKVVSNGSFHKMEEEIASRKAVKDAETAMNNNGLKPDDIALEDVLSELSI
jgi:hypothetical protein